MDSESIAAALLHDVVEDTPTTLDDLKAAFGEEVALLVDGVTKLTKIQFSNIEELQAENLRKMLLAMSRDVRVMIIKLCDRLHNMRTGDAWPEQKRRDKARETMEVYAPIANRLGILNVKEELEDRSLHYLDPVGYAEISRMLSERAGEEFLIKVSGVIERRLVESGIEGATIKRRVKSIYGIYRKTIMQNKSFDEIYDIYAVRVILRAEGAPSIFGGNAVEDEEAEQGRDGAGRKTQHERARDEQRERRQKAQPQDSQGHAGERQDVPGAETQLVGERRVAERASEHAGGHGRQHVAEQLGAVRGSEVHRQDEALEGAHDHDHAETDEHGRAQNCEGAAAAFSLCARSAMTASMPRSMRPYTSCWASL